MPEQPAQLVARLNSLTTAGYRENLLAKGLARGLVWRNGLLPPEAPNFPPDLTTDLLDHGFVLLSNALRLRDLKGDQDVARRALQAAGEALESAARHDTVVELDRGFHLVMAAAAFHIGGFCARAYSLFSGELATFNLSSYELALVQLMRRDLVGLRDTVGHWLNNEANSDAGVISHLDGEADVSADDVVIMALTRHFHHAIATFEMGLLIGSQEYYAEAIDLLKQGAGFAGDVSHVPLWWAFTAARHLFDDLWSNSLRVLLPRDGGPKGWPELRERFIQMVASRNIAEIDLWPSQVDAARRVIDASDDLVVALPTSAGKTRIAELCILRALAAETRVVYVTPLRALSAQIELGLARTFRPLGYSVTSVYGASGVAQSDLKTLQSASIVVATPEKLDFAIRQEPSVIDDVGLIVLDEGHMIGLDERELRYEMLVQRLLRRSDAGNRRLVCLSAVFSEGDPFDDFTTWLRSDVPGTAVRSTWRPTRQRPGRLIWKGTYGRLEFDVEQERPFVQHFVKSTDANGRRRTSFPNTDKEFLVAATSSFLQRGQSVLVYCPLKASVETTARAFLDAHRQGYFLGTLSKEQLECLNDALRIGKEWLGPEHPAVACLPHGIAVHHGSLPRQFLGEVESLLRQRILPVCICSPTLAQGLDLCFSVLLFRSLYRVGEPIPAKEFANVVGRVGRAFVDLDGLYVLPVFESNPSKARRQVGTFQALIGQAQQRQLESGIRLLLSHMIRTLTDRLQCDPTQLREYVLNMSSSWEIVANEGDESHKWMDTALNELDTAILGIIDTLDVSTAEVADYLDKCLQGSYWQRRLSRESPELRAMQESVIRGRAQWLWNRTTVQKRRAFFAAGIGFTAGSRIEERITEIEAFLRGAEDALGQGHLDAAVQHVVALAEILFGIGPFVPDDMIADWKALLGHWLRGHALGASTDNDGIGFIQQNVVYRLVWAAEAARLHLQHLQEEVEDPPGGKLALCLTYGVPNQASALLMQSGLRSRTLAVKAAAKAGIDLTDMDTLRMWVECLRDGTLPSLEWKTDDEHAEWNAFLSRFDHRNIVQWRVICCTLPVRWDVKDVPASGIHVRIERSSGRTGRVASVAGETLGTVKIAGDIHCQFLTGRVSDDKAGIDAHCFGY
ncbi:MAG: DEAD/DEAH box helicase [Pirellulaceae bacterium]